MIPPPSGPTAPELRWKRDGDPKTRRYRTQVHLLAQKNAVMGVTRVCDDDTGQRSNRFVRLAIGESVDLALEPSLLLHR